ncbi:MAG: Eukaryotic translation initiation factor eIF-1 [Heterodermia speciosa]|uniref:Eukaryotic translation initiation factor eIF-1 n=12 Tax=Opisthokonta TaxID=33154 RepID=A0A8H3EPR9_9LECA|nr:MAG: Eukaryotic translation initiation factor eIF-1 [Heterodermia speciosa]
MASKKDMRRADFAIPYADPSKNKDEKSDIATTMASTLPMAAMFTKNKASLVFAIQTWLAETPEQTRTSGTPSYLSVGMAVMAVGVTYVPLFMPPPGNKREVTEQDEFMSIENLKTFDPFAEADEDTGETKQSQNYIHIRIQQRNGRKTLTTVQGLPKKFDQKKILKVIKKKFACNGTIVNDTEMGEVIQLQGDQRKDVQEFLVDKKEGLELDAKTIKVHGF